MIVERIYDMDSLLADAMANKRIYRSSEVDKIYTWWIKRIIRFKIMLIHFSELKSVEICAQN